MHVSTFALDWQTRPGQRGRGYWVQTPRDFLDFIVDGCSPFDQLGAGDQIGVLGWGLAEVERGAIDQLLLRQLPALPTGRVPLYVCPQCGDVDCGAVAVRIEETEDTIVWSDFTFEVTYYLDSEGERVQARFEEVGSFAFDKATYHDVLTRRLSQVAV